VVSEKNFSRKDAKKKRKEEHAKKNAKKNDVKANLLVLSQLKFVRLKQTDRPKEEST